MAGYEAGMFGRAIMVARVAQGDEWDNPSTTVKALTMLADDIELLTKRLAEDADSYGRKMMSFAIEMRATDARPHFGPVNAQAVVDMEKAITKIETERGMLARFFRAHFGYRIDAALAVAEDMPSGEFTKADLDGPAHVLKGQVKS